MKENDIKNECKLMVLYLLKIVDFPINHQNLSDFFLDKYLPYIKFQELLSELVETKLIEEHKTKTSVFYNCTKDGLEALNSFKYEISDKNIEEINKYIKDNKIHIHEDSIINATYLDGKNGNYLVTLEINDDSDNYFKVELDVPNVDAAISICENWKQKSKSLYSHFIKQLL